MRREPAISVALVLVLAGCSSQANTSLSFSDAIDAGLGCPKLFEMRNELDPHDPKIPRMNEQLREIGCYMNTSERTDR
jgi:uncharacterized lipoprotein